MNQLHRSHPAGRARTIVPAILLILLGAGVMLYPKLTDLRYMWAQRQFAARAAEAQAAARSGDNNSESGTPHGGVALPDGAVAFLEIPAINLEAYVVEGTGRSPLSKGPGHYPDAPLS